MTKLTSIMMLFAAVSIAAAAEKPTASAKTDPGPRCKAMSWSPELYSLYGSKAHILQQLGGLPVKLSERRVFLEITQGEASANVKLFEQQPDGSFGVTEWTTKESSRLLGQIDEAIIANKGVNCVGEEIKALLGKELREGKASQGLPATASPQTAFGPSVEEAVGEFIRCTIIILC